MSMIYKTRAESIALPTGKPKTITHAIYSKQEKSSAAAVLERLLEKRSVRGNTEQVLPAQDRGY